MQLKYLILLLFISCNTSKEENKTNIKIKKDNYTEKKEGIKLRENKTQEKKLETKFVIATSGLNYRNKPKGNILGKFELGEELQIIKKTEITEEIEDNGKVLKDVWLLVKNNNKTGYIFGGFLKTEEQFNKINKKNHIRLYPKNKRTEKVEKIISNFKITITKKLLNTSALGYTIEENQKKYNLRYRNSEITVKINQGDNVLLDTVLRKENFKNISKEFLKISTLRYSFSKKENNKLTFFGIINKCDSDISYPFYHHFDTETQKLSIEEIQVDDELVE